MAKAKKPEKSTPKKTATKSPAQSAGAQTNAVAAKIATTAPVVASHLSSTPLRTSKPSTPELYDEIRRRAYEFYRERGGQHGSHEVDWHRAEIEVRSKYK